MTRNIQQTLFTLESMPKKVLVGHGQKTERLKRLDLRGDLREKVLPYCRLGYGDVWEDPIRGHKVAVLDASKIEDIRKLFGDDKAKLIINDPPYNVVVGNANTSNLPKTSIKRN